jgi:5-hydroxyisourate hydrolase
MAQAEPIEPTISTHVLDAERGMPAVGVAVSLYRLDGDEAVLVGQANTDQDGRVRRLLSEGLRRGGYRLVVELGRAGPSGETAPFFRRMAVDIQVDDPSRSYHVPLLVSPYALTTYRGS